MRAAFISSTPPMSSSRPTTGMPRTRLVGQTLAPRPYLTIATSAGKSAFIDFDPNNDHIRYFVAVAVRNPDVVGVAVARIDFDALEEAWSRAGERIMITDRNGIVFLTSDPRYKSRFLPELAEERPGEPTQLFKLIEKRHEGQIVRRADVDDKANYLYQTLPLAEYGWTIHRLTDITAVDRDARDGALIGGALSSLALSLFFISFQRQRALVVERRQGLRLKAVVAERTQELSDANISLQSEVEERRSAELQLLRTQNELVQAGKLAALGQMSAAIAHEINQPLTAIRTFVASTKLLMARGEAEASVAQSRSDQRSGAAHGRHHHASEDVRAQERSRDARSGQRLGGGPGRAAPARKPDHRGAGRRPARPCAGCVCHRLHGPARAGRC